jgi:hypothetical protein
MADKLKQKMSGGSNINIEVSYLPEDDEEIDISKGLETIPIRLQSTIKVMKPFQVIFCV